MEPSICRGCPPDLQHQKWERGKRWLRDGISVWPEHYEEPRICSGCGGCHPDDVIRMLKEGWTERAADGRNKGYMEPPGYQAELDAWRRSHDKQARNGTPRDPLKDFPDNPIKGPPVKFYVWHFSDEQREELNSIHKSRRG